MLVAPVVDDVLEKISVASVWHPLEKLPLSVVIRPSQPVNCCFGTCATTSGRSNSTPWSFGLARKIEASSVQCPPPTSARRWMAEKS